MDAVFLEDLLESQSYLRMGGPWRAKLEWVVEADCGQVVEVNVVGVASPVIIRLKELYCICPIKNEVGVLNTSLSREQVEILLNAPIISPEQVGLVREKLLSEVMFKEASPSLLPTNYPIKQAREEVKPMLMLFDISLQPIKQRGWQRYADGKAVMWGVANLVFAYGGNRFAYNDNRQEWSKFVNNEIRILQRDKEGEEKFRKQLASAGLQMQLGMVAAHYDISDNYRKYLTFGEAREGFHRKKQLHQQWENFMQQEIPKLRAQGWGVIVEEDFQYNIITADDAWYAEISEGQGIDWFGFELGVTIEGERLSLVPILLNFLHRYSRENISEIVAMLPEDKPFLVEIELGRRLALPAKRIKMLLQLLQQLFSFSGNGAISGQLKLKLLDATLIAEIEAATKELNLRWMGGERVRQLGQRLQKFEAITEVKPAQIFQGQLRPYQQEGLNWLQFLREYGLAGILADDMGLGKTVQMLAHIAIEKERERISKPILVVAPTSLMYNWQQEASKFVPELKVLVLHGVGRKGRFDDIQDYDLVLTTYPLLPRDKDQLLAHEYYMLILDEAQSIKNSQAKLTQIVNQLKADHRLCMTGTPIENNLGELWSLFNFLLPGYLGTQQQFVKSYRTAIEKNGDLECNKGLSKRIRPFTLRRTKQEVALELPEKTEIVRMIELDGEQRDLYEAIRVSMQSKVQQAIAERGVEKSHIIILDALLKLRQVCCDPSLLKVEMAEKIRQSAKREELMRMLIEMVEEGKKILLFSQFSSMLALIAADLQASGIDHVQLTGQTQDRGAVINRFQEGVVPVFLISLKAGGTGLNLTAADTVIHYDPWWNPAVERQATDRAYRIGQGKPVFVYKLIAAGTIEEKILEMQSKKQQLIDNLFSEGMVGTKLNVSDLQALFEPLAKGN